MNIFDIFSKTSGASFIGLDTETVVPLLGGQGNPFRGRLKKITIGSNVMVFQNRHSNGYENMIRRRMANEGLDPDTFNLQPRKWGTRVPNFPIVTHEKDGKTNLYLEVIFIRAGHVKYVLDDVHSVDPVAIEGFKKPDEPDDMSQGGLNRKVIIRTYGVDSILCIRVDHNEFRPPFV